MPTKKLAIITIVIFLVVAGATVAALYFSHQSSNAPEQPSDIPSSGASTQPEVLEQEAESMVRTDPEEASDKYEEASELYEDAGEADKAAEAAANAAAADASTLSDAPPTEGSSTSPSR